VGQYSPGGTTRSLTMHWDGSRWSVIRSPAPGDSSTLLSVAAITATVVWAGGSFYDPPPYNSTPLTLRSNGCAQD
jgi:hypothetical protein